MEKKVFPYGKLKEEEPEDLVIVECACCRTKLVLLESPYVSFFDHRDIPLVAELSAYSIPDGLNRFNDGHICEKCWENKIEKKKK